ncbi:MAG TPA: molecular chaperone TorD family protein [Usitatibacter sp.]|nr:molecular chaperone TorD family protein [Usitatibacter sp.]
MAAAAPVVMHRPLAAEEAARADFYALIARLLVDAPDSALLHAIAQAGALAGDSPLAGAWQALVDASSAMDGEAARGEYDAIFSGLGLAKVSIYAGHYTGAAAADHPRVRIQRDLEALGLAHRSTTQPEDHVGALFDAMRVLVAGGAGRGPASLEEQRKFFEDHVRPGASKFFAALAGAGEANYYRRVAAVGAAFLAIEAESFQMD